MKALLLRLSGQTLIYGLSGAAVSVIGIFTFPILGHTLSPREYGVLELTVVAATFLALFIDLGLASASQRSYYDYPDERRRERRIVLATALSTCTMLAVVLSGIVIACSGPLAAWLFADRGYQSLIVITAIALPVGIVGQFFREIMRLTLRPWPYALSATITAVLGGGSESGSSPSATPARSESRSVALTGALVALLVGLLIVRQELVLGYSRRELRIMLRYGLPLVPSGVALWGLSLVDRVLLSRLTNLDEVGRYAAASRLAAVLTLATVAFTTAYSPFLLALHSEDAVAERELRGRVLTYLTTALFMLALVIGLSERAHPPGRAGLRQRRAGGRRAPPRGAAAGIGAVALAGITIARATASIARHTAVALVVNVAACLTLIPPFGTTGAAIGTAIGYVVVTALYFRTSQRLDPAPFEARRVAAVIGVVVVCAPVAFVDFPSTGAAIAGKVATLAVATALLWPLGVIGPMELIPARRWSWPERHRRRSAETIVKRARRRGTRSASARIDVPARRRGGRLGRATPRHPRAPGTRSGRRRPRHPALPAQAPTMPALAPERPEGALHERLHAQWQPTAPREREPDHDAPLRGHHARRLAQRACGIQQMVDRCSEDTRSKLPEANGRYSASPRTNAKSRTGTPRSGRSRRARCGSPRTRSWAGPEARSRHPARDRAGRRTHRRAGRPRDLRPTGCSPVRRHRQQTRCAGALREVPPVGYLTRRRRERREIGNAGIPAIAGAARGAHRRLRRLRQHKRRVTAGAGDKSAEGRSGHRGGDSASCGRPRGSSAPCPRSTASGVRAMISMSSQTDQFST